jgi:hypothetical protein
MDDRLDPRNPPGLERLRPKVEGGAFPRPPLLPVVAVMTLLLGLSLGLALAPKQATVAGASPSPSASLELTPNPPTFPVDEVTAQDYFCFGPGPCASFPGYLVITEEPTAPPTPPAGGVTMAQAVASATKEFGFADKDVVAVRLVDNSQFYTVSATDTWSWEIYVRGPGTIPCGGGPIAPSSTTPDLSGAGSCIDDYDLVVVDYLSGHGVLEVISASYP